MTNDRLEKKRAQERRWYARNRARRIAQNRRWRERNPDAQRASEAKWREDNPEKEANRCRSWRQNNLDTARAKDARRRARKAAAAQDAPALLREEEARVRKLPCAVCGSKDEIEVDHIEPLSRGGAHACANFQPLCRSCNARKGVRTMEEFCPAPV